MTEFIKLTKITNWKIDSEKGKKEPTTTKTVYVRPCDIVSFESDDGTTIVRFADGEKINTAGIHVKESAEEIYEMIHKEEREYTPLIPSVPFTSPYRDPLKESKEWWYDFDWWNHPTITCDSIAKNIPYYGYAIVVGNGEIWE